MTAELPVPDKLYFKIGEVARLVGVKPYVLRYWESEFSGLLRPEKTTSRHRLYRRRDIETLRTIRRLLHDERYTIEGAKRRLRYGDDAAAPVRPQDRSHDRPHGRPPDPRLVMARVRGELLELARMLEHEPAATPAPLVIGEPGAPPAHAPSARTQAPGA